MGIHLDTKTKGLLLATAVVALAMALPALGLYQRHELIVADNGIEVPVERSELEALTC